MSAICNGNRDALYKHEHAAFSIRRCVCLLHMCAIKLWFGFCTIHSQRQQSLDNERSEDSACNYLIIKWYVMVFKLRNKFGGEFVKYDIKIKIELNWFE